MNDDELIEAVCQAYWDALAVDSNTSRDCFRVVLAVVRAHDRDGERYRWLRPRVSGAAYRSIGIEYGEASEIDAAIDAAMRAEG